MGTQRPENKLGTAERRQRVIELRREGHIYRVIARKLEKEFGSGRLPKSWDATYVGQDLRRALERAEADLVEEASDFLQLELERLDAMQARLWPKAMAGELGAVDRILAIMKRRSKYLGLDAPQRHEVRGSVLHEDDIDWESLTDEQLEALAAGAPPEEVVVDWQ